LTLWHGFYLLLIDFYLGYGRFLERKLRKELYKSNYSAKALFNAKSASTAPPSCPRTITAAWGMKRA